MGLPKQEYTGVGSRFLLQNLLNLGLEPSSPALAHYH